MRCLLSNSKTSSIYWGEAARTGILNISPTRSVWGMTSYQAWHGRSLSVHHMFVLGCITYAKNTSFYMQKLDNRCTKLVLQGYEARSKANRLLNPRRNQIMVSRDVVFQEETKWKWQNQTNPLSSRTSKHRERVTYISKIKNCGLTLHHPNPGNLILRQVQRREKVALKDQEKSKRFKRLMIIQWKLNQTTLFILYQFKNQHLTKKPLAANI